MKLMLNPGGDELIVFLKKLAVAHPHDPRHDALHRFCHALVTAAPWEYEDITPVYQMRAQTC
eukprot:211734-Rhodomonas_salina.2